MAGSSNFLVFNPSLANQEDDASYAADSQRLSGAINGQPFNDQLANKLFYQLSVFISALAASLANKNYNLSDASVATLESVLANIVTFADLKANLTTVAFSTTPVFSAIATNGFDFTLAGNVASSTLTGQQIGQTLTFVIKQGSVAYTFTPPTNINGWITISTTPNSVSVQTFIVRADGTIWPTETEIGVLLGLVNTLQTQVAALQAEAPTSGSYTIPSGSMDNGTNLVVSTGVAIPSGRVPIVSMVNPGNTQFFVTPINVGGYLSLLLMNIYGGNTTSYPYPAITVAYKLV